MKNPFLDTPPQKHRLTREVSEYDITNPSNLSAASLDLYRVVHKLVVNDGNLSMTDWVDAVAALRLAQRNVQEAE